MVTPGHSWSLVVTHGYSLSLVSTFRRSRRRFKCYMLKQNKPNSWPDHKPPVSCLTLQPFNLVYLCTSFTTISYPLYLTLILILLGCYIIVIPDYLQPFGNYPQTPINGLCNKFDRSHVRSFFLSC